MKNTILKKIMTFCLHKSIASSFILCLSFVFCILGTSFQVQAMTICHGDPIVRLSNGAVLHATTDVAIDSSQLGNLHITYTLHVPSGTSIQHIVYTGGSLSGRESVQLDADQPLNSYSEQVLVTSSVSASVTTTFAHQGAPVSASGLTNQIISLVA